MPFLHAAIDDRHALINETLELIFGKPKKPPAPVAEPKAVEPIAATTLFAMFRAAGRS